MRDFQQQVQHEIEDRTSILDLQQFGHTFRGVVIASRAIELPVRCRPRTWIAEAITDPRPLPRAD